VNPSPSRSPIIGEPMGKHHTIARMGDADRAIEPRADNGDKDNRVREGARRPEVAALVAKLRDGVDGLRALPLEGVPPALGDRPWP
jgi:hypothetical protein